MKIIFVRKNSENLDAVLIHEICHAIASETNHGRRWQNRMLKAAKAAERKQDSRIANLLRKEVESYRNGAETIATRSIYSEIEECVSDNLTEIPPFRAVAKQIARRYGLTRKDFLNRYPRAKKVYRDSIKRR